MGTRDLVTPHHPFAPRVEPLRRKDLMEKHNDTQIVLCEYYLQVCRNCGYHFGKMVNRITATENDVLVCPQCGEPRSLCRHFAYKDTFQLEDGLVVRGIPRCVFHGGKAGITGRRRAEWLSSLLKRSEEEAFCILTQEKMEGLEKDLSDFLVTKLGTVWQNDDIDEERKFKITSLVISSISKLVSAFASLRSGEELGDRSVILRLIENRVLQTKRNSYKEIMDIMLNKLVEVGGEVMVQRLLNALPHRLRELSSFDSSSHNKDDAVEGVEYEVYEKE